MKQFWNKDNWDYNKYVKAQTALNKKKISNIWVQESEIKFFSQFVKGYGICHGARNGFEVRMFKKYVDVIGTDISDNAEEYGLIQWDFHKQKKEWIGKFDFVYTNSLDHSYDPILAIKTFMDQLKIGGKCLIHDNGEIDLMRNAGDCLGTSHNDLMEIFKNYSVEFHKTNYKNRVIYVLQI